MLNSDRSPCTTPAHSMRTTSRSSVAWWATRLSGVKCHIVQARRGVAVRVGHQLHQQHAVVEVVRRGHAHAGGGQAVQRIDLGALPGRFLRFCGRSACPWPSRAPGACSSPCGSRCSRPPGGSCAAWPPCRPWRSGSRRRSAPRRPSPPCRSSAGAPRCRSGLLRSGTCRRGGAFMRAALRCRRICASGRLPLSWRSMPSLSWPRKRKHLVDVAVDAGEAQVQPQPQRAGAQRLLHALEAAVAVHGVEEPGLAGLAGQRMAAAPVEELLQLRVGACVHRRLRVDETLLQRQLRRALVERLGELAASARVRRPRSARRRA